MTDKIAIFVTTGKLSEARKIARHLVTERLAACVNITAPLQSVYRWQGKVESAREFLLIIKTTRGLFDAVRLEVARLHSYATPEVIALPIVDGSPDYLQWLEGSVKRPNATAQRSD